MIKFKRNKTKCFDELWEILTQDEIWCCKGNAKWFNHSGVLGFVGRYLMISLRQM